MAAAVMDIEMAKFTKQNIYVLGPSPSIQHIHKLKMAVMETLMPYLKDEKVLAGLTAATVGALVKSFSSNQRRIPGPPVWPVVGSLPYLGNNLDTFADFAKKYGDIYYLQLGLFGNSPTVVLNNISLIKEALLEKQDDFAGRYRNNSLEILSLGGSDIIFSDFSPRWQFQRKIAHAALRKYANGQELQDHIEHCVGIVSDIFVKSNGKPMDIREPATLIIYNILASMCFGKKFELNDPDFQKVSRKMDELNENFTNGGTLADIIPALSFIPTPQRTAFIKLLDLFIGFITKELDDHKESFDKADVRDLAYYVIQVHEEMKEKGMEESGVQLSDVHFQLILSNMFFAGTDTSRNTLHWALLLLAAHPEVQKRAQQEIDEKLGRSTRITATNRMKIPYCEAIIYETLRIRSPAPMAVPHQTTCNTSVGGYDIPKGWQVYMNLGFMHMDQRVWDNPQEFRPERFIDEDGNLAPKPANFLPFSTGRRQCVGEALAKTELHVITGMLLQRFSFYPEPGKEVDISCKDSFFAYLAKPNNIVVKER